MLSLFPLITLGMAVAQSAAMAIQQSNTSTLLPVHDLLRSDIIKFENLAIRPNGQILTTTTYPNASIYQVDPLGILPMTLIHQIPNITSATGITEGKPDVFYIASGDISLKSPTDTVPQSYSITEIDMRSVLVLPNGTLTRKPIVKRVASLPNAALPNGIAFADPTSDNLLVADTFRGLIWNVNVSSGAVGVTLNDTTTKGDIGSGSSATGINGIKVHNGTIYWTNTGRSTLYRIPVDEEGNVPSGVSPTLITSNLTCDDLVVDNEGNTYVAGPLDIITKVSPLGQKEVIAGAFNSTTSDLIGPTAIRFGRLASDQWSMYVTSNGGVQGVAVVVPGSAGVSRIDLGYFARKQEAVFDGCSL